MQYIVKINLLRYVHLENNQISTIKNLDALQSLAKLIIEPKSQQD